VVHQHLRVPDEHAGDHRSQPDSPGHSGRVAQRGVGLQHRLVRLAHHLDLEEVVHRPQAGKPGFVGSPGNVRQLGCDALGAPWLVETDDLQSQPNRHTLLSSHRALNPSSDATHPRKGIIPCKVKGLHGPS